MDGPGVFFCQLVRLVVQSDESIVGIGQPSLQGHRRLG
jgi:hypothetical protein